MRNPTAIDAIADAHVATIARLQPILATQLGIPGYDHLVGDFSPAGHEAVAQANRATLIALDEAPITDDADAITVAAMRDRLGLELELHEAGEWQAELNVIESPVQAFRDVLDLMPIATADDWAAIASRLAGIPQALDGYTACLREGLASGLRPARLQVDEVIKQVAELAEPATSRFTALAADAPEDAPTDDLQRAALSACEAYGRLGAFLRESLLPGAPDVDAVGRERYARLSRLFVGAAVDLDETYAWGVDELARIAAEQDALARMIGGEDATTASVARQLDADPARTLHGTDALKAWMQQTSDAAVEALDGVHFDLPPDARRLECCIAPSSSGGIYYTGPSADFTRPGRMWWAVPEGVETFATWGEKTTVYHEGVPGHHLQISTAMATPLNDWRRLVCWTSGHGEGWALYAERLMDEFGFLDPAERLGMLDGQRLRAARVVVDLGVHLGKPAFDAYGGGVWDRDKAWALLCDNTSMDRAFLRFELNRYLGWPGQAPSYKIGQRLWEQCRADAETAAAQRGEPFSLRDFHARALALGSLPLDVLRSTLKAQS